MTQAFIIDFAMESIKTTLLLSAPMLGFGLITGLAVSIFQAVTSIQELTLTFIPKILAVFLSVLLFFTLTALLPVIAGLAYLALHPGLVVGSYVNREFTLTERLLTELRVLWEYVSVLLLPDGAKMGLVHDDFQLSRC